MVAMAVVVATEDVVCLIGRRVVQGISSIINALSDLNVAHPQSA